MIERKTHPPFGSNVKRFLALGYHPRLEVLPGTFKNPKLCPGYYNLNRNQKIVSKVPRWKRQMEIEEFSLRLGLRNDHILKQAKWLQSLNGPGWQEIPCSLSKSGIAFAKAIRFPVCKFKSFSVPGPGTYGKNHVPSNRKEEKSLARGFSFSNVPPFEQRSYAPRSLGTQQAYHLPPNHYNIKTSINELISKKISKRGPYDLFTVNRFPDPKVNNAKLLLIKANRYGLNHPNNAFKGKFLKCGKNSLITSRQILKELSLSNRSTFDPAPNHYDPYPTRAVIPARAPFDSSVSEVRPVIKCDLSPPPGRYNPLLKKKILGCGMKSAFHSKVLRTLPQQEKLSWFE